MVTLPARSADRVLGLDDEDTALVIDALSTESARQILTALNDGPATVGELADTTDLTAQNVCYHLEKLTDADLVHRDGMRGTGGNAATVYTLANPTILSTAPDATATRPNIGAFVLTIGVLLTLLCMHSLVEPSVPLHALVEHGVGTLLSLT